MITITHLVCQERQLKIDLGKRLHELRLNKRLSILEVSKKTKIPCYVIDLIELGKSSRMGSIEKLCNFYNKTVALQLVDLKKN